MSAVGARGATRERVLDRAVLAHFTECRGCGDWASGEVTVTAWSCPRVSVQLSRPICYVSYLFHLFAVFPRGI